MQSTEAGASKSAALRASAHCMRGCRLSGQTGLILDRVVTERFDERSPKKLHAKYLNPILFPIA